MVCYGDHTVDRRERVKGAEGKEHAAGGMLFLLSGCMPLLGRSVPGLAGSAAHAGDLVEVVDEMIAEPYVLKTFLVLANAGNPAV
jgi:hypothetical protein